MYQTSEDRRNRLRYEGLYALSSRVYTVRTSQHLRSSEGLKPQERLLYLPLTPMSVVFVHSRQDEQKSNQKSTALKGDILTMSGDPSKGNHPWSKREPYLTSRSAPPAGAFKETALEGNRRRRKRKKKLGGICSHRSTLCTWVPTVWSTETTKNGAVELV